MDKEEVSESSSPSRKNGVIMNSKESICDQDMCKYFERLDNSLICVTTECKGLAKPTAGYYRVDRREIRITFMCDKCGLSWEEKIPVNEVIKLMR